MKITQEAFNTNIGAARLYLLTNAPFFGALLYGTKINSWEGDNPPSCAWTDGEEIFFHVETLEGFLEKTIKKNKGSKTDTKLVFESLTFVVIHELMHCMFTHIQRKGSRDALIWNIATDITINTLIAGWFPNLVVPEETVRNNIVSYDNKNASAEIIYDELIKTAKVEMIDEGKAKVTIGKGKGKGNKQGNGNNRGYGQPGNGAEDDEITIIVDLVPDPNKNAGELEDQWRSKIEEAKATCNGEITPKTAGHGSQNLGELLDELYAPKVDWRNLIDNLGGELAKGDYSFMRRAKRSIAANYYMPDLRTYEPFVLVAVDVSGSISSEEYKRFMSEVGGILAMHNCKVGVIQCDTEIKDYVELEPGDEAPRLRGGCGGTYFAPVFEFASTQVSRQIDAMLYFTDGYNADRGFESKMNPEYPLIWVMTTDYDPPKVGSSMKYDPFD